MQLEDTFLLEEDEEEVYLIFTANRESLNKFSPWPIIIIAISPSGMNRIIVVVVQVIGHHLHSFKKKLLKKLLFEILFSLGEKVWGKCIKNTHFLRGHFTAKFSSSSSFF